MTTPLDRDLAERLERLAAAVPIRPGQLDPVHARAVRARRRLRMSWLTPLVGLVVVVLVGGAVGGSLNILNGPISATTKIGDFELTLRSAKSTYSRGEQVVLSATLTYTGPERSTRISHASSPMTFGIVEPVHGMLLNGVWAQSCGSTELERGVGLERPFTKSFSSPDELQPEALLFAREPNLVLPPGTWHPYVLAEFARGECGSSPITMRTELTIDVVNAPAPVRPSPREPSSPTLVPEELAIHLVNLDPSTVEIVFRNKAIASLACGESTVVSVWELESAPLYTFVVRNGAGEPVGAATLDWGFPAGILIRDGTVLSGPWPMSYGPIGNCDPDAEPSPSPSPAPAPLSDRSQTSGETDGDFEFVFASDKQVYRPGEPIHLEARLIYHGVYPEVVIGHDMTGAISFHLLEKVFGKIELGGLSLLTCRWSTLARDEPLVVPFPKAGGYHTGSLNSEELAWLQDPVMTLPVGTWHFTAGASSPCMGQGATFRVDGQLTIVVRDDLAAPEPSPS